jgi:undecaprenyl-diphosphatase
MVFAWLANGALREQAAGFDAAVRDAVHAWATPSLTLFMLCATQLGSGPFLIAVGALAIWRLAAAGRKHAAFLLAVAAIGGEALDQILKLCFHRPRPDAFFGLTDPPTYSFPSGHALTATCFYGVLAAVLAARMRPVAAKAGVWALAAALAALIGLSRVYLGVHYPSDVLAGYAAAVVWVAAVRAGYGVWRRRRSAPPA